MKYINITTYLNDLINGMLSEDDCTLKAINATEKQVLFTIECLYNVSNDSEHIKFFTEVKTKAKKYYKEAKAEFIKLEAIRIAEVDKRLSNLDPSIFPDDLFKK